MSNNEPIFSNKSQKLKVNLTVMSGVSLFVGLTESLPTKLTIIGLELGKNNAILGWFIFFITLYFVLHLIIISALDLVWPEFK